MPCVRYIANRNLLCDSGNSDRGSATGGGGEGDGREVWEGGDMGIPISDSC